MWYYVLFWRLLFLILYNTPSGFGSIAEQVEDMKLVELDVPDKLRNLNAFTVRDGWLYYSENYGQIKLYNLPTEEERTLKEGLRQLLSEESLHYDVRYDVRGISSVNGRINVLYGHYGRGLSSNVVELDIHVGEREDVKVAQKHALGDSERVSSSLVRVHNRIFSLETYRFYEDPGIDLRYNAFTWNGLMCYLTNEGNEFYLNSFPLESGGNETTKKQLWFLNDAREAFGWRKSRSFVCGDAAYIFFSRKYASHSTVSTRLVRINLRDSTIKDLTRSVEGVTDIRTIREGAEDGKSIYLIGEHQAHNRNTLWKLSCQAVNNRADHGYFLNKAEKEKKFVASHNLTIEEDIESQRTQLLKELNERIDSKLKALKETLEAMATIKRNVLVNGNVPALSPEFNAEFAKYEELAAKAQLEKKAFEEWTETVVASFR